MKYTTEDYLNQDLNEFEPFSKPVGELYQETLKELVEPYPAIKLPGWDRLNQLTGGLRMREFSILCGATGSGKTTLLANWAKSLLLAGKRCFVMSVETGHTDFIKRTLSAFVGVDINQGIALDRQTIEAIHSKYGHHFMSDGMFMSLYDNRVGHETCLKEIQWHKEKKGCDVVFIDNLNFLLDIVSQNRQLEVMDKVVHDFIMFSKRTDVHIVMVMHPKKTDHGRVESEFDIKGSSTAVQEAYNVFLFNRPKEIDLKNGTWGPFMRELTIRKLRRRGASIGKSIWLKCDGSSYAEVQQED